jgi:hypothetical protein
MSTLRKQFKATLQKSPSKGAWTYVVMPDSVEYFGTRASARQLKRARTPLRTR